MDVSSKNSLLNLFYHKAEKQVLSGEFLVKWVTLTVCNSGRQIQITDRLDPNLPISKQLYKNVDFQFMLKAVVEELDFTFIT